MCLLLLSCCHLQKSLLIFTTSFRACSGFVHTCNIHTYIHMFYIIKCYSCCCYLSWWTARQTCGKSSFLWLALSLLIYFSYVNYVRMYVFVLSYSPIFAILLLPSTLPSYQFYMRQIKIGDNVNNRYLNCAVCGISACGKMETHWHTERHMFITVVFISSKTLNVLYVFNLIII